MDENQVSTFHESIMVVLTGRDMGLVKSNRYLYILR